MKAYLPLLFAFLGYYGFAQNKTENFEIHLFNHQVFGRGMHSSFYPDVLDTLLELEGQFSCSEFIVYISVNYIGTHSSNLKLTKSMCNTVTTYLKSKLDTGTVCNCIALGEEQLAWNEDIYLDEKLIIPKDKVVDQSFIESFDDRAMRSFLTTYSNHIKIIASKIPIRN